MGVSVNKKIEQPEFDMRKHIQLLGILIIIFNYTYGQEVKPELTKYVDFLELQNTSAKDYVINLWQKYDVVILGERNHGEMTQYDLIYDIVKSDYFIKNVGNIFTEVGSVSKQKEVLEFIKMDYSNKNLREQELLNLYRNIKWPVWEKSNFYYFIKNINILNSELDNSKKINLFLSDAKDPDFNQSKSKEAYQMYLKNNKVNRDILMAQNIINVFDEIKASEFKRKKCLVIMNFRHSFSKTINNEIDNYLDISNVGNILFDYYGDKTANVYLNSLALTMKVEDPNKNSRFRDYIQMPVQNGKWDASFKALNIESLGFNFKNSPFGEDSFDIWPWSEQYTYKDVFTGFIFYLPIEKHFEAFGVPNLVDNDFEDEVYKRLLIFQKVYGGPKVEKDEIKNNFKYLESKYDEIERLNFEIDKWIINK